MFSCRLLIPACALLLGLTAAAASAQTVINSVPYTISVSGKYVLGNNFAVASGTSAAIFINAPNVILDLNGFYVSGPGNTPASTLPVIAVNDVGNVTIRNGTVANYGYGISFNGSTNSRNYLVENVNVTHCTIHGIHFNAKAAGSIVRNNTFSQNGGSTQTQITFNCSAIFSSGGVRIENNSINEVATGPGTGAISYGINASNGDFSINNTVTDCSIAINFTKYRDTLTYNCPTLATNGTAVGFNN